MLVHQVTLLLVQVGGVYLRQLVQHVLDGHLHRGAGEAGDGPRPDEAVKVLIDVG